MRKIRKIFKVVESICLVVGMIGFLLIVGTVGSMDLESISGEVVPLSVHISTGLWGSGLIVVASIVGSFSSKVVSGEIFYIVIDNVEEILLGILGVIDFMSNSTRKIRESQDCLEEFIDESAMLYARLEERRVQNERRKKTS